MDALIIILAILAVLLVALVIAWAYLVAPARYDRRMDKFKSTKYAHRGLHGEGACENSLTAFARAVEAGFGIELDIRLSREGRLVVFHDDTLTRVAGVEKKVADLTVDELRLVRLGDTDDYVPTFREVLDLVGGRVPLLIEIKMGVGEDAVAKRFLEEIEGYEGDYIVESFNPSALRTVREARPDVMVGFLSMKYSSIEKFRTQAVYRCLEGLLANFLFRPNFIAYEKGAVDKLSLRLIKKIFSPVMLAWTVRSPEEEAASAKLFDSVIFENYIPEK